MTTDPILSDPAKSDQPSPADDTPLGVTTVTDYSAVVQAARLLIRAWLPTLTAPAADPEPGDDNADAA